VLFAGAFADLYGVIQVLLTVSILLLIIGLYNLRRPAPVLGDDDRQPLAGGASPSGG
jgi:hypothetical protein